MVIHGPAGTTPDLCGRRSAGCGHFLLRSGSPVPHACHTPGGSTVSGGNSRVKRQAASAHVGAAHARSGLPIFQTGICAHNRHPTAAHQATSRFARPST